VRMPIRMPGDHIGIRDAAGITEWDRAGAGNEWDRG
jgi:hypothetical protein